MAGLGRARRRPKLTLALVPLLALAACGGQSRAGVVKIEGPSYEPRRIPIRTLEPGPAPTPSPTPTPTPKPTPTPPPMRAPGDATMTSDAGTQRGDPRSYCWYEQVGGPSKCFTHDEPTQPKALSAKRGEVVLLKLDAQTAPNEESIRSFRGSRSGYPDQPIEPALETDLTIDLPEGTWSMDVCATWYGRGQPICWLFKLEVTA